jgi:hypothetical protein
LELLHGTLGAVGKDARLVAATVVAEVRDPQLEVSDAVTDVPPPEREA